MKPIDSTKPSASVCSARYSSGVWAVAGGRVDGALLGLGEPEVDADREAVRPPQAGDEGLRRTGTAAGHHHVRGVDALEDRRDLLARGVESTRLVVEARTRADPLEMPRSADGPSERRDSRSRRA